MQVTPRRARVAPSPSPRMSDESVDELVVQLLRNPQVLAHALSSVKPDYFREPELQLLWGCVVEQSRIYGVGHVPFKALYLAVLELADLASGRLTQPQLERLIGVPELVGVPDGYARVGLVYHAYHQVPEGELNTRLGQVLLQRFLHERAVSDEARRRFAAADLMVPGDLDDFALEMMGRLSAIKHIGGRISYDLSDEDLFVTSIKTIPTGMPFIDDVTEGGDAAGELYMLFAPQKGGKTTMLVQRCCTAADAAYAAELAGEEPTHAYFFAYEEEPRELLNRFYAYGALIRRPRLNYEIRSEADFTTEGNLLPYELRLHEGLPPGVPRKGERERFRDWKRTRGKYVHVKDMTRRTNPQVGGGGIPEIVAILNQELAEGRRPGVVCIDYLNPAIDNLMAMQGVDPKQRREMMLRFVVESINALASPFAVPVWLANQYDASSQKRSPGAKMSLADGAESKTLGDKANFGFCIGNRDPETGVAQLTVDVARRATTQKQTRQIRLDGDFSRWVDVTGQFDVNEATGAITSKAEAAVAAGLSAAVKAKMQAAPPPVDPYELERAAGGAA